MSAEALAFALGVAALLALRHILVGPWLLLDADLGWHLGYGRQILSASALPMTDAWSFTRFGHPYQLTQWGGEALLGVADALGGDGGLLALAGALLTGTFALCYAATRPWVGSAGLACLICGTVPVMLWSGTVRPVLLSWLLVAWTSFHLSRLAREWHLADVLVLPLVVAVWANLHGSFALGVVVVVCGLGVVCHAQMRRGRVECAWAAFYAAVGAMLATGLNPYGLGVWKAVWQVSQLATTREAYFADWKSPALLSAMGWPAAASLVAAAALAVRRAGWSWVAGAVAVAALGLSAQRNAPLAGIMAAPFVARALAQSRLDRECGQGWRWPIAGWVGRRRLAVRAGVGALVLAPAVLLGRGGVSGAEAQVYPVQAGLALDGRVGLRLLNEFEHGGWWIRRHPGVRVAIDGRADLHGDAAYSALDRIKARGPGWQEALAALAPDAICLSPRASVVEWLRASADFALLVDDPRCTLFVRR